MKSVIDLRGASQQRFSSLFYAETLIGSMGYFPELLTVLKEVAIWPQTYSGGGGLGLTKKH